MGRWWKIMYRKKTVMPTRLKSQSRHCSSHHGRMQWGHERKTNWTVALGWGFPSGQPPTHTHTAPPNPAASLRVSLSLSLSLGHLRLCLRGLDECWRNAERGPSLQLPHPTDRLSPGTQSHSWNSWVWFYFVLFATNLDSFRVSITKSYLTPKSIISFLLWYLHDNKVHYLIL